MEIHSSAFKHQGNIPKKYTCQGEDISPPLLFSGIPKGTKSLALIMEDPDVPEWVREDRLWIHWIIYNLSPDLKEIKENQTIEILGLNTLGKKTYMGPCPPDREHRYFFTLYALDTSLSFSKSPTRDEMLHAMKGHILEKAQLIGLYEKVLG